MKEKQTIQYKRILTLQDISCLGQCSATVALPILSACGHEACVIPTAVLSTHTGQFKGYTCHDLTEDIPAIIRHWKQECISFDAVYTGYLSSARQAEYVVDIIDELLRPDGVVIVDPAMGDNGRLYAGLSQDCVNAMKSLCTRADVILPNITEACMLTGTEYKEQYDEEYVLGLFAMLHKLGVRNVILTGVAFSGELTGVAVDDGERVRYFRHGKVKRMLHGTGDVYASAFTGALLGGFDLWRAASIAAQFTMCSIENTLDDSEHWYGVKFETALPMLIKALGKV